MPHATENVACCRGCVRGETRSAGSALMSRILVVEDEVHIAEGLAFNLEAEGHDVELVGDGHDAVDRLHRPDDAFDLVILDLMLPGLTGHEVARRTRASGNYVPILILTAKDDPDEVVKGIEEGADDFLTKPFANVELLARLRAVMRRTQPSPVQDDAHLRAAGLCLDPDRRHVEQAGQQIALSPTEFALLASLVRNRNRIRTRRQLEEEAMPGSEGHSLDVHISNLRRKIGRDLIRTVRGVGYVVDDREAA